MPSRLLRLPVLLLALLAIPGCDGEMPSLSAGPLTVETTGTDGLLIDGEPGTTADLLDRLQGLRPPSSLALRLPPGEEPERLWGLWSRLVEAADGEATSLAMELPVARGDGAWRSYAKPPVFLILSDEEGIVVWIEGSPSLDLEVEDILSMTAYVVAGDPRAPFVLVVGPGTPGDLEAAVLRQLTEAKVLDLERLDPEGLRPIELEVPDRGGSVG